MTGDKSNDQDDHVPKSGTIATLADMKPMLPILYSASSAAAMASALDRALRLTGSRSLSQIPANVAAWEALAGTIVWTGEFTRRPWPRRNRTSTSSWPDFGDDSPGT